MSRVPTNDQGMVLQVRQVLARALEIPLESISPAARQGELEKWDSLGHLNVVMELEAQFGVSLTTDKALNMRSVAQIVEILKSGGHGS